MPKAGIKQGVNLTEGDDKPVTASAYYVSHKSLACKCKVQRLLFFERLLLCLWVVVSKHDTSASLYTPAHPIYWQLLVSYGPVYNLRIGFKGPIKSIYKSSLQLMRTSYYIKIIS